MALDTTTITMRNRKVNTSPSLVLSLSVEAHMQNSQSQWGLYLEPVESGATLGKSSWAHP